MDDKLTRKSQEALSNALQRASAAGNPNVDGLHLLAALLEQEGGITVPLLRAAGADPAAMASRTTEQLARLPQASGATHERAGDFPPAARDDRGGGQAGQGHDR